MGKLSIESVFAHLLIFSCIAGFCTPTFIQAKKINISVMIRDSLSLDSIPLVKVTVEELGQSFKTTRSGFCVALQPATYSFIFEAENYEPLSKTISIDTEGQQFFLKMVTISDRLVLEKRTDSLNFYLEAFRGAIENGEITLAERYIAALEKYDYPVATGDSIREVYEAKKLVCIDSLFDYARALEDSGKLADAYYYYNKVVAIDSLNETALTKMEEADSLLFQKKKDVSKQKSKTAKISPEEIEKMYSTAVSKFLDEDYNGALSLLRTVLKYQPNHEGAKNYLVRTEARLKVLGN
ncbi:MAG: hypothetical protein WBB67_06035 [bacterium]